MPAEPGKGWPSHRTPVPPDYAAAGVRVRANVNRPTGSRYNVRPLFYVEPASPDDFWKSMEDADASEAG